MPAPVLIVTPLVAPDRVGAFRALQELLPIELALFGGRSLHATGGVEDPGVPVRHVGQRDVLALAARGGHRAVVCGTAGRLALPLSYAGARAGRRPFVLWDALWHQPRSAAHAAGAVLMRHVLRHADAVAAYGTHVERYARAHGARRVVIAPQAVDRAFWEADPPDRDAPERRGRPARFLFLGRDAPGKGLPVLREAWARSGLEARGCTLEVVGPDTPGGARTPAQVRNSMDLADVVVVPSVPTLTFREPWGLVCNEAMHRSAALIATRAVGAVAGGLVRDGETGVVVPPGDPAALASALSHLAGDRVERRRLGASGHAAVQDLTHGAWAAGMAAAIELAEHHREHRP